MRHSRGGFGSPPSIPTPSAQPRVTWMLLSALGSQRLRVNETPGDLSEFTPGDH